MGLFDVFKKGKSSAKAVVSEHEDTIDGAIDKVADVADGATGAKHTDKIDGVADTAKDAVDKLTEPD